MFTGNYYFLPATALCLIMLVQSRPTQSFVADKLYLNDQEKEDLLAV
jgi:hypothetical protein